MNQNMRLRPTEPRPLRMDPAVYVGGLYQLESSFRSSKYIYTQHSIHRNGTVMTRRSREEFREREENEITKGR